MISAKELYEKAVELGIKTGNWQSDLYMEVTEESEKLIADYKFKNSVRKFKDRIDQAWWFDIPFGYSPFWEETARKGKALSCKS